MSSSLPWRVQFSRGTALLILAVLLAMSAALVTAKPAGAIFHPAYQRWHDLYYLDGAWLGMDMNGVMYSSNSDGTETVTHMYAGVYRSTADWGLCCILWRNPWLTNRDGTVPLSLVWGKMDCGYGCQWVVDMWQGSVKIKANKAYGMMQHETLIGGGRWAPYMVIPW